MERRHTRPADWRMPLAGTSLCSHLVFTLAERGPGWPGVYSERRLRGVRDAPDADVVACGSWEEAVRLYFDELNADEDALFTLPLRVPVDEAASADEMLALVRWFLRECDTGAQRAVREGVNGEGVNREGVNREGVNR